MDCFSIKWKLQVSSDCIRVTTRYDRKSIASKLSCEALQQILMFYLKQHNNAWLQKLEENSNVDTTENRVQNTTTNKGFTCLKALPANYLGEHSWVISARVIEKDVSVYLSNRPQVSVGYKLINHAGCWYNTRRIRQPRAAGEWFTNSSSVLPTPQVVYQPITHRNLWFIAFI